MRVFSGIQPTGAKHLGNYSGGFRASRFAARLLLMSPVCRTRRWSWRSERGGSLRAI